MDITIDPFEKIKEIASRCESVREYIDTQSYLNDTDSVDTLDEVGTYSITVELANNKTRKINIFSSFPVNERVPVSVDENTYSIIITADAPKADFVFNALLSTLIVALILLLADWMLYSHEQF